MDTPEKQKLFDEDAERAILGSIFKKNHMLNVVATIIKMEYFFLENHKHIYQAMLELTDVGQPIDEIAVVNKLREKSQLTDKCDYSYCTLLQESTPASIHAHSYANIVKKYYLHRQLLTITGEISKMGGRADTDIYALIQQAQSDFSKITDETSEKGYDQIGTIFKDNFDRWAQKETREIVGLPTGFSNIDDFTTGLQKKDLIIVAARPSMGKTAFTLNIAQYVAIKKKLPVLFFSLEMSKEQIGMRILSSESRINSKNISLGKLNEQQWTKLINTCDMVAQAPLFINDIPNISPIDVIAIARKLNNELAEQKIALIVIDYLQLLRSPKRMQTRDQEVGDISRSLKLLAKEFDAPVIVNSQLNRYIERRDKNDQRPILSDLRDSGSIEQDADIIAFIYRDTEVKPRSKQGLTSEIIFSKFRNGETGTKRLVFFKDYVTFAEYTSNEYQGTENDENEATAPDDMDMLL